MHGNSHIKFICYIMCVQLLRCDNNGLNGYGKEGINPVGQVAQATIFCTVATNVCGPS